MMGKYNRVVSVQSTPLLYILCICLVSLYFKPSYGASYLEKVFTMTRDLIYDHRDTFGSDITNLVYAYREYKRMDRRVSQKLGSDPLQLLAIDFCIQPMKFVKFHTGKSKSAQDIYMKRMKGMLRYFWPAYLEKELPKVKPFRRIEKMRKLCNILNGMDDEMLTLKHFLDAKIEQDNWLRRMNDIRKHEDIYTGWKEYAKIMQYLNQADFKIIRKKIFPILKKNSKVAYLKMIFVREKGEQESMTSRHERKKRQRKS